MKTIEKLVNGEVLAGTDVTTGPTIWSVSGASTGLGRLFATCTQKQINYTGYDGKDRCYDLITETGGMAVNLNQNTTKFFWEMTLACGLDTVMD